MCTRKRHALLSVWRSSLQSPYILKLYSQVKNGTHDLDANLALLRFYQYSPTTAKVDVTRKVFQQKIAHPPACVTAICESALVWKDMHVEFLRRCSYETIPPLEKRSFAGMYARQTPLFCLMQVILIERCENRSTLK